MKLTLIGAGSPRTPLLLQALLQREIQFSEIALYDIDSGRIRLMERLFRRIEGLSGTSFGNDFRFRICITFEEAVSGADFIFSSMRVGGDISRMKDETAAFDLGLLGQETIGAGGFAMALRTIPEAVRQAEVIQRLAPNAWIINFTNPSGIVTQAVRSLTGHRRTVGICDAPIMIQKMAGAVWSAGKDRIQMKYFGLNHLGWCYSLMLDGKEKIQDILGEELEAFTAEEPFYAHMADSMRETGLIPNEYLYYYLHYGRVLDNLSGSGVRRGAAIREFNREFFEKLGLDSSDPVLLYNEYISRRDGSYMTGETGEARKSHGGFDLTAPRGQWGYDAVALDIVETLALGKTGRLVMNVENGSYCPSLAPDDIIEVSGTMKNRQFLPDLPCPVFPETVMDLITGIKSYERGIIRAVRNRSAAEAAAALAGNPLIPRERAEPFGRELIRIHRPMLDYLK